MKTLNSLNKLFQNLFIALYYNNIQDSQYKLGKVHFGGL